MENNQEFVITKRKGVLSKYNGPGGDVVIPEGVKEIGKRAFQNCTGLTSVVIPESVTEIGYGAFMGCTGLQSVTIPEGVKEIGGFAFRGCTELREVTVPGNVKTIGRYAFGDCGSLENLTILGRVEEIDKSAFYGCLDPIVLTVPNFPISKIDKFYKEHAFQGFVKAYLENMEMDEEMKAENLRYIKSQKKNLVTYKTIGEDDTLRFLFETGAVKPADIEWMIQKASIVYRSGEAKEKIMEYKARYLDSGAPVKKAAQPRKTAVPRKKTPINIDPDFDISPKGVLTEYKGPGGDVVIPEGVKEIGDQAFTGCMGLASVTIPEGVRKIGYYAFGESSIQSVIIPKSVRSIKSDAFRECENLTSVTILAEWKTVAYPFEDPYVASRPVLIAPHTPIEDFAPKNKPGACAGFAKAYLDGMEMDEEIRAGYLKYIKGQRKRLVLDAVQHEELLQLMIKEKMLARADIDLFLTECDRQNNVAAKAAVLDYAGRNLKPVDPTKEFKLKDL